ncbi:MAG: hypothetical protein ACD_58C00241G0002 [uncultured bacterium]|nr:MAG: hypothetical protein ACD_58C00241G0002 [uncultured bacterium]
MSKLQQNKSLFNLMIVVLGIIAIGILFTTNGSKLTTKTTSNSDDISQNNQNQGGGDLDTKKLVETIPTQKILYSIINDKYTDIYSYDFVTNKPSKVFTDKDEVDKIKTISSITNEGKVLALMSQPGQEFSGKLYLIRTDGSGKKELLIDDFASPQPAQISPDGKKLCYILFSNSEKDFGFKLIEADSDGSNKKQLTTDTTNISQLGWSPDSNSFVYIKSNNNDMYKINITTLKEEKITTFNDDQLQSFSWSEIGIIISKYQKGNNNFNNAEIFTINLTDNSTKKITSNSLYDNFAYYDSLGNLVYLSLDYDIKDANILYKQGKIQLLSTNGITKEVTNANQILGWKN